MFPSVTTAGAQSPVSLTGGEATGGTAATGAITTKFGNVLNSNGIGFWGFLLIAVAGGVYLWKSKSK